MSTPVTTSGLFAHNGIALPPGTIHVGGTTWAVPSGKKPPSNSGLANANITETINGKKYQLWFGEASAIVTGTAGKIAQGIGTVGIALVAPELVAGEGLGTGAAAGAAGAEATSGAAATGAAAGGAASAVKAVGAVTAAVSLATIVALFTSLAFWTRVGEVVLGGVLMILGLRAMTTGNTSIPIPGV